MLIYKNPNKDNPTFYQSLSETVKRYKNHNVVIVGDWNLVLDSQLDCYNYKHNYNPKAKEVVENRILELELTDVWRENNPQCKRYTWRKPNPLKQARLDFILLSDHLMWHFDDTDILPGYRSDHSIVMLKLKFGKDIKHNTFWKFNSSLLRDKEYLDQVNIEIQNVTEEYAADHYDRSTLHNIPKSKIELSIPDKLFLDFMLMKIRSETVAYASMKKKKTQEKEHNLQKSIKEIETKEEKTEEDIKFLQEKKSRINFITRKKDGRSSIEVKSKMGC